jgi:hypothetical protein
LSKSPCCVYVEGPSCGCVTFFEVPQGEANYHAFVIKSPVMRGLAIEQASGRACPQTMSAVMGEGLKPLTIK